MILDGADMGLGFGFLGVRGADLTPSLIIGDPGVSKFNLRETWESERGRVLYSGFLGAFGVRIARLILVGVNIERVYRSVCYTIIIINIYSIFEIASKVKVYLIPPNRSY
jgi:hypothetical protein